MNELPFAISPQAAAQIESILLAAQRDLNLLGMARVLGYAYGSSWKDTRGRESSYPLGHIVLGWSPIEEVLGNDDYTELNLVGFRVYVDQRTLDRLCGKQIVVDKGKGAMGIDILAVRNMPSS
jgi:hypothetical protein